MSIYLSTIISQDGVCPHAVRMHIGVKEQRCQICQGWLLEDFGKTEMWVNCNEKQVSISVCCSVTTPTMAYSMPYLSNMCTAHTTKWASNVGTLGQKWISYPQGLASIYHRCSGCFYTFKLFGRCLSWSPYQNEICKDLFVLDTWGHAYFWPPILLGSSSALGLACSAGSRKGSDCKKYF